MPGEAMSDPVGWRVANGSTVTAVASAIGIVLYMAGFVSGYLLLRENVGTLQVAMSETQVSLELLSTRMTKLEDKVEYTNQGVADLKALLGTKH